MDIRIRTDQGQASVTPRGFPLMEEYVLVRRLRALGPVRILSGAVSTSVRRYESNGPFRNALRNAAIMFLFYLGVGPHALARLYR